MTVADNSCDNIDAEKKNPVTSNEGSSVTRTSSRASSCRTSDFSINEYSPMNAECDSFKKQTESDLPPFKSMKQKVSTFVWHPFERKDFFIISSPFGFL